MQNYFNDHFPDLPDFAGSSPNAVSQGNLW